MIPRLTPAVKFIILLTTGVYILELLPGSMNWMPWLALTPGAVLQHGMVWQLFTYMLLHSQSPMHILMNMMTLYFFGGEVESAWGTKRFAWFYVICGVGAGLCALLFDPRSQVIGASGAVFGVMVAFALLFPDAVIYFFGMIPMKAPHLVLLFIVIEMAMVVQPGSGVSSWAHLGGAAVGWLYVKYSWRLGNWWKASFGGQGRRPSLGPTPITARRTSRPAARPSRPTPGGQMASVTTLPQSGRAPAMVAASAEELAIQRRADDILDKISREGMGSLSREEREILHKHSQILKAREGDVVKLDDYRS